MENMIEPYKSGYIPDNWIKILPTNDIAQIMRTKSYPIIYINSFFVGTAYAERAKEAAKIANKKLAYASLKKMHDKRLVPRRKRH